MQNVELGKTSNENNSLQCYSLASLEARRRRIHQYRRPRTPVEQALLAIDRLAD
jgi:hypothetical protein